MKSLALALLFAGIAFADPTAITWTGPATIDQASCLGCPYGTPTPYVDESTDGLNADLSLSYNTSAWGYDPSASFAVTIPFNVSGDALVALNGFAMFDAAGTNCTAVNCQDLPSWDLSGGFAGQVVLDGGNGTAINLFFGGMQTVAASCDPSEGCLVGYSSPGVSITNPLDGQIDLAAGDYTLTIEGSNWDSSVGDSMAELGLRFTLSDPTSPVPEPRVGVLWLGVGLVGMLARRRKT